MEIIRKLGIKLPPLSREFLLSRGYCCNYGCLNCPYPKVVHCKKSKYDVYIGRPSIWGNPFEIGPDGSRDEVVQKFEKWLDTGESFGNISASEEKRQDILKNIKNLKGKVLACWCSPQKCHGDILLKKANEFT